MQAFSVSTKNKCGYKYLSRLMKNIYHPSYLYNDLRIPTSFMRIKMIKSTEKQRYGL